MDWLTDLWLRFHMRAEHRVVRWAVRISRDPYAWHDVGALIEDDFERRTAPFRAGAVFNP